MARVRQVRRRYRSAALSWRGLSSATLAALPLAETLDLAAEELRQLERGNGERNLAAAILEAHRDGQALPEGMTLAAAAQPGCYALTVRQEQPGSDYDRLHAAKTALNDLAFARVLSHTNASADLKWTSTTEAEGQQDSCAGPHDLPDVEGQADRCDALRRRDRRDEAGRAGCGRGGYVAVEPRTVEAPLQPPQTVAAAPEPAWSNPSAAAARKRRQPRRRPQRRVAMSHHAWSPLFVCSCPASIFGSWRRPATLMASLYDGVYNTTIIC